MRHLLHDAFKAEVRERLAKQEHTCTACGRAYQVHASAIGGVAIRGRQIVASTHCPHCRAYQVLYVQYVRTLNQANRGLTLLHA